jgi:hypothetical protein
LFARFGSVLEVLASATFVTQPLPLPRVVVIVNVVEVLLGSEPTVQRTVLVDDV